MNLRKIALLSLVSIVVLSIVIFGSDYNNPIDQSSLEYLKAL